MVRLTLNKPYTLHARSIDRITGTPSDYKLNLKDPITCARHADRHADLSSRRSVTRIARHGDDHRQKICHLNIGSHADRHADRSSRRSSRGSLVTQIVTRN